MSEQQEEKGTFEKISLALLLVRALDRRWSGTLTVGAGEKAEHLEFQRGLVCRALVPDEYARIGQLLVDAKVVTNDELKVGLDDGGLLGAALVEASLIDDTTLQRALVLQLLKRTSRLFGSSRETPWSFSPNTDVFDGMPEGVRIDTLRVLWAGLSAHGEMGEWLDLTLKRVGDSPFQVRKDVNLRRYGFTGDARKVVRAVRDERLTLQQLQEKGGGAPEDVVRMIVYLLAITRYLDFNTSGEGDTAPPISSNTGETVTDEPSISDDVTVDETSSSDAPASSGEQPVVKKPRRVARIKLRRVAVRPAAPDPPGSGEHRVPPARSSSEGSGAPPSSGRTVKPKAAAEDGAPEIKVEPDVPSSDSLPTHRLAAEVKGRLGRLSQETPFSLLNVTPDEVRGKSDDELTDVFWTAYEKCSRKWHPDQCPDDMSELKEGMEKIYDAMTEAFMNLTESEERHALVAEFVAIDDDKTEDIAEEVTLDTSEAGPPSSGERPVESPKLSPTELHAKALVALSEQRLDEALTLCRSACDADKENPDYLASSVWIRASMDKPDTKVLLLDLDGLLREHPDHIQARFYRGVLRRRLGSDNAAKRDFERVLEQKASHAGAKAQLQALTRGKKKKAGK